MRQMCKSILFLYKIFIVYIFVIVKSCWSRYIFQHLLNKVVYLNWFFLDPTRLDCAKSTDCQYSVPKQKVLCQIVQALIQSGYTQYHELYKQIYDWFKCSTHSYVFSHVFFPEPKDLLPWRLWRVPSTILKLPLMKSNFSDV
jgi:hypothetical protein